MIPLTKKAMFFCPPQSLPKLLHGAGTWPPLTKREYMLYAGTVWALYRGILNVPRDSDQKNHLSNLFRHFAPAGSRYASAHSQTLVSEPDHQIRAG